MNPNTPNSRTLETVIESPLSGWLGVAVVLVTLAFGATLVLGGRPTTLVAGALLVVIAVFLARGLLTLQPNESAVLILFGRYAGTVRSDGFFWVNPFYVKKRVSLRVHNFNTPTLKVNDRAGSPIDVAAVIT